MMEEEGLETSQPWAVSPDIVKSQITLYYEDDATEERFRQFLVPKLPPYLLPIYSLIAVVLLLFWLDTDDKSDLSTRMVFMFCMSLFVMSAIQTTLTVLEKCYVTSVAGRARLVTMSNIGLLSNILLNTVLAPVAFYASVNEDCITFLVEPNSKEARYYNCSLRYNVDGVQLMILVVLFHNIPFAHTIVIGLFTVGMQVAVWLPMRPVKNTSIVVVQSTIYIAVGAVLLCAIRRDHEIAQREHFEQYLILERQVRLLRRRRRALLQFSQSVLPASLLNKVSSHAVGNGSESIDFNHRATVVIIGAHGLEEVGRSMLDTDVAKFVASVQEDCERAARAAKLDVIRVIGDHFAAVGNLLEPKDDATAAALRLSMMFKDVGEGCLSVRGAIDVGPLYGRFVGTNYVRYDVSGPAFDQCYRAWLHGTGGDVIVTAAVAAAASLLPSYTFSMLISGNESGSGSGSSDLSVFSAIGANNALYSVSTDELGNQDLAPQYDEDTMQPGTDDVGFVGLARMLTRSKQPEGLSSYAAAENGKEELADVTRRVWCGLLLEFTDSGAEARYVEHRQTSLAARARFVWTAYAAFLAGLMILAVADLRGPNAAFAVVLLVITIFLALFVGTLPAVWSSDEWRRYALAWSILGSVVPLMSMIAVALTRPSAVGNDVRVLFTLGCLVRSYTFPNVRLQLVLTPVLVGLGSLQYLLPYAAMRPVYTYYAMALWSLFVDVERDSSLRAAFFAHDQAAFVLVSLREEERLRDGLIRSTLPDPVYRRVVSGVNAVPELRGLMGRAKLSTVSDTTVCLLNFRQSDALSMSIETKSKTSQSTSSPNGSMTGVSGGRYLREEKSHRVKAEDLVVGVPDAVFGIVESVLAHETEVAVVTVAGDQVLLAAPLVTSLRNAERAQELKEDALIATTRCALSIAAGLRQIRNESADAAKVTMSALLEFDTTSQYLRVSDFPRFSVFGLATRRLLALGASIPLPDGVFATERASRTLASAIEAIWDGAPPIRSAPLEGRWAVRGVGVVRLVRLMPSNLDEVVEV